MNSARLLESQIRRLAGVVALAVGLLMPALSLVSAYQNRVGEMEGEARVAALAVTEFVNTSGGLWQFQQERLKSVLTATVAAHHATRVVTPDGVELARIGAKPSGPVIVRSHDFLDFGQVAGRVELSAPVKDMLLGTVWPILLGIGLGLLVFFPLRRIPLRALRDAVQSLRESEELNRTVVASLSEGIVMVDREGRLLTANESARAILGARLDAWTSLRDMASSLRDEENHPLSDARHPIAQAFASGQPLRHAVIAMERAEGGQAWLRVNIQPLHDALTGEVNAVVASIVDISEDRAREAELARARDAAEAASRTKSQFLANMSHEIRTPMNGVLGMAQLLAADATLTDKQRRYLDIVQSSGESLLRVIDDILDFSKIEAGRMSLSDEVFDPRERVAMTLRLLETRAHAKHLELSWWAADAVPAWVKGDAARLHQILTNLVGNAIKFTEKGAVSVRVETDDIPSQAEDICRLRFTVSDTGIGIPAEYMPRLFTLFSQADETTSRRFGGTGLGLAISRQLVELMGGEMEVESEAGQGSSFRFTVLLGRAEPPAAVQPPEERVSERALGGRVLVVEDEPTNRMLAKAMLKIMGCTPALAESGEAALDWLEQDECDLILMDCQMPGLDGYETTRLIREREQRAEAGGKRIPIVALTANALSGDRELCLAAGMDDYLSKPYSRENLEQKVRRWLPPGV